MQKQKGDSSENLEKVAISTTNAFGTVWSVVVHTVLFLGAFLLIATGANLNRVLLVLTTLVSLEAIYLSIFIKMSSNQQTKTLEKVESAMEEIESDVEEIRQDVNTIEKEVDGMQEKHESAHHTHK